LVFPGFSGNGLFFFRAPFPGGCEKFPFGFFAPVAVKGLFSFLLLGLDGFLGLDFGFPFLTKNSPSIHNPVGYPFLGLITPGLTFPRFWWCPIACFLGANGVLLLGAGFHFPGEKFFPPGLLKKLGRFFNPCGPNFLISGFVPLFLKSKGGALFRKTFFGG